MPAVYTPPSCPFLSSCLPCRWGWWSLSASWYIALDILFYYPTTASFKLFLEDLLYALRHPSQSPVYLRYRPWHGSIIRAHLCCYLHHYRHPWSSQPVTFCPCCHRFHPLTQATPLPLPPTPVLSCYPIVILPIFPAASNIPLSLINVLLATGLGFREATHRKTHSSANLLWHARIIPSFHHCRAWYTVRFSPHLSYLWWILSGSSLKCRQRLSHKLSADRVVPLRIYKTVFSHAPVIMFWSGSIFVERFSWDLTSESTSFSLFSRIFLPYDLPLCTHSLWYIEDRGSSDSSNSNTCLFHPFGALWRLSAVAVGLGNPNPSFLELRSRIFFFFPGTPCSPSSDGRNISARTYLASPMKAPTPRIVR